MGKRKERDAIIFLNDHLVMASEALSPHDCGRLLEMIRQYSIEGKETDLTGESRIFRSLYVMMRRAQDRDIQKYEETCEKNRIKALKRTQPEADGCRQQPLAATAATAANIKQYNIKQSNTIQDGGCAAGNGPSSGQEIKGVPGVAWM